MKNIFIILLALLSGSSCLAQLMSGPEITGDNRVIFRINAPEATEVKVINLSDSAALGDNEYILARDDKGIWTVTTQSCRPGLHYYELSIDGARVSDPSCPAYFGWGKWTSCIEVPGAGLDFYLPNDVPHGEVSIHWYFSKTTGSYRKCLVYTPPGYDQQISIRYPVLYLQHGAGESELGWTMQGKANFILDNLLAEGKARPMIIVMDNGYAARPGADNPYRPDGSDNLFADLVTNELIPMIDAQYRTLANRENRAIAGLSMGGGQALNIGLTHPELFASVATFSGGSRNLNIETSYSGVFNDASKFNSTYKLFFIGCGTLEGGYAAMKRFHEALTNHGINNTWSEPVGSHEWQVWRFHLYEFAQKVFQ
jgi:enterochelin esterase-like enzyme